MLPKTAEERKRSALCVTHEGDCGTVCKITLKNCSEPTISCHGAHLQTQTSQVWLKQGAPNSPSPGLATASIDVRSFHRYQLQIGIEVMPKLKKNLQKRNKSSLNAALLKPLLSSWECELHSYVSFKSIQGPHAPTTSCQPRSTSQLSASEVPLAAQP